MSTKTRRPFLGMKPRTLRSYIEQLNQPDSPDKPLLDRIHHHAAQAWNCATNLYPFSATDGDGDFDASLYALSNIALRSHLRAIDIPETWPRSESRIQFHFGSAYCALDGIIKLATNVMRQSAPLGLDSLADYIVAPRADAVFHRAGCDWRKRLETGYLVPRPIDWPRWKIEEDTEDILGRLENEVEDMSGTSTATRTGATADIAAIVSQLEDEDQRILTEADERVLTFPQLSRATKLEGRTLNRRVRKMRLMRPSLFHPGKPRVTDVGHAVARYLLS